MATNDSRSIEALAAEIGENVYMDIAKWHLYLREAHLHTTLAEQFLPMLESGGVSENKVKGVLQGISVKLGGGKVEVPLSELVPVQAQNQLMDVLEEFQRNM